jgi:hypothetical protein
VTQAKNSLTGPKLVSGQVTRDEARRDRGQQKTRPPNLDGLAGLTPRTAEQKNGKALLAARDTEGDYRRIGWTTRSASFL